MDWKTWNKLQNLPENGKSWSVEERLTKIKNTLDKVDENLAKIKNSVDNPPEYTWLGNTYESPYKKPYIQKPPLYGNEKSLSVEEKLTKIENALSNMDETIDKLQKTVDNPTTTTWLGNTYESPYKKPYIQKPPLFSNEKSSSVEERLTKIENTLSNMTENLAKLKKSVDNPPKYTWLGNRYN